MKGLWTSQLAARLAMPTAIMGVCLWYLSSLWDARMRQQNLILILPVVIAMLPFYLWIIVFELRRHAALGDAPPSEAASGGNRDHLAFMAVSLGSVALFYLFGAIPATVVTLVVSLLVLHIRSPRILIAMPCVVIFVLWVVFVAIFGIRIPLFLSPL